MPGAPSPEGGSILSPQGRTELGYRHGDGAPYLSRGGLIIGYEMNASGEASAELQAA